MSDLKKIIDQEINHAVPLDYFDNVRMNVMRSIPSPRRSLNLSFAEKRDNILLFFMIVFCSVLIYFFGYSEHYRLSIFISKNLIFNFLSSTITGILLIVVFINEYFDRKKKIFI